MGKTKRKTQVSSAKPSITSSVPVGVKIISVLYCIGAAISLLVGILLMAASGFMGNFMSQMPLIGLFGQGLFIAIGIIFVGFGVLGLFVGRGLWNGKNWARIIAIIFAVLGILSDVYNIFNGIYSNVFTLAINLAIGGYLLFSSSVKSAFS